MTTTVARCSCDWGVPTATGRPYWVLVDSGTAAGVEGDHFATRASARTEAKKLNYIASPAGIKEAARVAYLTDYWAGDPDSTYVPPEPGISRPYDVFEPTKKGEEV
jgi:hypothetical protein